MFFISKTTPLFFIFALLNLFIALFLKIIEDQYIHTGLILIFGFIGATILGAMYQIIPNSQQRKLPKEKISFLILFLLIVTLIFIYIKSYKFGSITLLITVLIFIAHTNSVLKNLEPVTVRFLVASLFFLFLTSLIFIFHSFFDLPVQLVIHTFTIGVMINAVLGVEFAWIPMFYMQTIDINKGNKIFVLQQLSTLFLIISFYLINYKLLLLGVILELLIIIYFLLAIFPVIKGGKKIVGFPYTVKFFITGLLFLVAGLIVAGFMVLTKNITFIDLHIDLMIFGFGTFTIIGGMLHLTPRILWNLVYVKKVQVGKKVPQVQMVIQKEKAELFFWSLLFSLFISVIFEALGFKHIWFLFYLVTVYFLTYFSYTLYRFYKI